MQKGKRKRKEIQNEKKEKSNQQIRSPFQNFWFDAARESTIQ